MKRKLVLHVVICVVMTDLHHAWAEQNELVKEIFNRDGPSIKSERQQKNNDFFGVKFVGSSSASHTDKESPEGASQLRAKRSPPGPPPAHGPPGGIPRGHYRGGKHHPSDSHHDATTPIDTTTAIVTDATTPEEETTTARLTR